MAQKVGIKQIAEQCGVSKTAVSMVLNNRAGVSDSTRERIRRTIGELGYRPNQAARRLGRGGTTGSKSGMLGFLAFDRWADSGHSYYGQVLAGASLHAQELGVGLTYHQVIDPTDAPPDSVDIEALDGLLVTGKPTLGFIEAMRKRSAPIVVVSPSTPHIQADSVRPENIESAWVATRHLIELGHTQIGYLGGQSFNADAQERHFGYRLAMQEAGLEVDDDRSVFTDFSPEGGEQGMRELIERGHPMTAVFAGGDYLALGAYDAAHHAGLSIPGDLSIVGFDDIEPVRYLRPALTTVHIDLRAVGARAVDRLMQLITADQSPLRIRVPGELVLRDSTAPV
ncbi:MAG: LacI family DNA-binding transcriptional regulator [Planctomycetota bacterium]